MTRSRLARSAYLISRPTSADVLDDEGAVILSGHPQTPATWEDSAIDRGWSQHVRDDLVLHALRIGVDLWLIVQREPAGNAALVDLAAAPSNVYGASLKDTWIAARLGTGPARGIMRRWPDWLVSGFVRNSAGDAVAITRRSMVVAPRDTGIVLPATVFGGSGPWHFDSAGNAVPHLDASEHLHVTAWHRPALKSVLAGYADETPEDGTPED